MVQEQVFIWLESIESKRRFASIWIMNMCLGKSGPKIHENLKCAVTSLTSLEKEVLLISWRDNDDAAPAVPDCLSKCGQILSGIAKWEFLMLSWFHGIIFLISKIPNNSELQNISRRKANRIYHAPNFVLDNPFSVR